MPPPRLAIIGCGAAGAFCGALLKEKAPDWDISFFEAGKRPLAKLALTGGGRCNLTNSFEGVSPSLREVYPRGYRLSSFDCILAPSFDNPAKLANVVEIPANLVANDAAFYEKGVASFKERYSGATDIC